MEATQKMPLLDCIETISHIACANPSADDDRLYRLKLDRVRAFFRLPEKEARYCAYMFMQGYEGRSFNAKSLLDHFELSIGELTHAERFLKMASAKGWIGLDIEADNQITRAYEIKPTFFQAVLNEDKKSLRPKSIQTINALLQAVFTLLEANEVNRLPAKELFSTLIKMHKANSQLPFVRWLDTLQLSPVELGSLYYAVYCAMDGNRYVLMYEYLDLVYTDAAQKFDFATMVRAGKTSLISLDLLEFSFAHRNLLTEMKVTDRVMDRLGQQALAAAEELPTTRVCEYVRSANIIPRTLYFDQDLDKQFEDLALLMDEQRFNMVRDELIKKGLNPGIAGIFHGVPGSGKTESVLQLAARTGRDILKVNISKIRSKWVGESEKNIAAIFKEYRQVAERTKKAPILLFNEADALIGKRRAVNTPVDQMDNVMQNILLEELENFDGILIATTNLVNNMDEAFERRFIFKFRFEKPAANVRFEVWKSKFSFLPEDTLAALAGEFDLSPAQIDNISKKYEIQRILYGIADVHINYLRNLARQEQWSTWPRREPIGFRS